MKLALQASLATVVALAPLVVGCESPVEQLGRSVDPLTVEVATQGCPDGYQHRNICCSGGDPDNLASCFTRDDDPFAACADGMTAYPDASSCCAESDPTDCTSCEGGHCGEYDQPPADGASCVDGCPPGWAGDTMSDATGCCQYYEESNGISQVCTSYPTDAKRMCLGACPPDLLDDPTMPCCAVTNETDRYGNPSVAVSCNDDEE